MQTFCGEHFRMVLSVQRVEKILECPCESKPRVGRSEKKVRQARGFSSPLPGERRLGRGTDLHGHRRSEVRIGGLRYSCA
jgi:hypothetical protein